MLEKSWKNPPALKIDFIYGPVDKDENDNIIDGYVGTIKKLGIVCSGKSKEDVLEHCSIRVLLTLQFKY